MAKEQKGQQKKKAQEKGLSPKNRGNLMAAYDLLERQTTQTRKYLTNLSRWLDTLEPIDHASVLSALSGMEPANAANILEMLGDPLGRYFSDDDARKRFAVTSGLIKPLDDEDISKYQMIMLALEGKPDGQDKAVAIDRWLNGLNGREKGIFQQRISRMETERATSVLASLADKDNEDEMTITARNRGLLS